jgi:hypothetical protein
VFTVSLYILVTVAGSVQIKPLAEQAVVAWPQRRIVDFFTLCTYHHRNQSNSVYFLKI